MEDWVYETGREEFRGSESTPIHQAIVYTRNLAEALKAFGEAERNYLRRVRGTRGSLRIEKYDPHGKKWKKVGTFRHTKR